MSFFFFLKNTILKAAWTPLKASLIPYHVVHGKTCWSRYLVPLTCITHTLPSPNHKPLWTDFSPFFFFLASQSLFVIPKNMNYSLYTLLSFKVYTFKSKTAEITQYFDSTFIFINWSSILWNDYMPFFLIVFFFCPTRSAHFTFSPANDVAWVLLSYLRHTQPKGVACTVPHF